MSAIDLLGFFTIFCLGYIGYHRGFTQESFFLISFGIASIFCAFLFTPLYMQIEMFIQDELLRSIIALTCTMVPVFLLSQVILKSRISRFMPSHMQYNIPFSNRLIGMFFGLICAYVFVSSVLVIAKNQIDDEDLRKRLFPTSVLMRLADIGAETVHYKGGIMDDKKEKMDNLSLLTFLYSEEAISTYKFSRNDLVSLLKMIKGISNQSARKISEMYKDGDKMSSLYKELSEEYTEQKDVIDPKYTVERSDISDIQDKVKNADSKIESAIAVKNSAQNLIR